MEEKGRKRKPENIPHQGNEKYNVKVPVIKNSYSNTTLEEVDDKLIGDDFEMAIVNEKIVNNEADKNKNNY